jgi:hypothetical protein
MPVNSQDRIRFGTQSSVPVSFTPWSSTSSTYRLISKIGRRTRFRNSKHTGATTAIRTILANHHKATRCYLHVGEMPTTCGLYAWPGGGERVCET